MPGRADDNTAADPAHAPAEKRLVKPVVDNFPLVGRAGVLVVEDVVAHGQAYPVANDVALHADDEERGVDAAGRGQAALRRHTPLGARPGHAHHPGNLRYRSEANGRFSPTIMPISPFNPGSFVPPRMGAA